jgi:CheY-like chemotaxis protein
MNPIEYMPLNILLADDDKDDRFFFGLALKGIPFPTQLTTVEDGERLMAHLKNSDSLPDVLFLDLNMPKKNGFECLSEIKLDPELSPLPVIIYSTAANDNTARVLYEAGAHYYVSKRNFTELQEIIEYVLNLIVEKKFVRCSRAEFVLEHAF